MDKGEDGAAKLVFVACWIEGDLGLTQRTKESGEKSSEVFSVILMLGYLINIVT